MHRSCSLSISELVLLTLEVRRRNSPRRGKPRPGVVDHPLDLGLAEEVVEHDPVRLDQVDLDLERTKLCNEGLR